MARDKEKRKSLALVRTQTMERAQGNAAPIEFRTLSIHVTETHRSGKNGGMPAYGKEREAKPSRFWKGKSKEDVLVTETDFFSTVDFHKLSESEVNLRFNSDPTSGLTQPEADRRLKANGLNTLESPKPNYFKMILGYTFGGFCSILWVGVITFLICWQPPLSPTPNVTNLALAILVLFVIILQASFSAFQDFSTAKVMSSILDMIPADCHVIRDGQLVKIPASGLVVGDRVHLSLGNKVPADLRLLQASSDTRFDRAVLTGESEAIEASTTATDDNFLESKNIAFMGTHVVQGSCVGVVILKGNDTLMGRINKLTTGRKPKKTIIQREITRFIQIIIALTVSLILIITIAWLAWLHPVYPDFMNLATLLVTLMGCVIAFIPEGVPVCISLTLLMIARRMRENDILPKALSTVETLGCVNVICSDKTGTLTENKMHISNVAFLDYESTPSEVAANIAKGLQSVNQLPQPSDDHLSLSLRQLQLATLLCNNAKFDPETMKLPLAERKVLGDATDSALLRFAHQVSDTSALAPSFERTFEIPFNSRNKWMMTAHQGSRTNPQVIKTLFGSNIMDANNTAANEKDDMLVFVKGAPDVLLPYCSSFWSATTKNGPQPLTPDWAAELTRIQQTWSRGGKRVLMLCKGRYSPYLAQHNLSMAGSSTSNAIQEELTRQGLQELCILGLVGIMDPPRAEIKDTIRACRGAGARFFMVTGDFGLTATAIAKQIGLFSTEREPHTYENIMDPTLSKSSQGYGKAHFDDASSLQQAEVGRPRFREGTSLVLTGSDLAKMSPGEWDIVCAYEEIVFARTSPEQKLRIVTEFQHRDGVVAVTGDGVNDAPALKAADVGVAVVSGSDVAIEAADLILLGGFDAIPEAIRLGRLAFQNLQKVIGYLLPAGSWSEVWPVLINVFLGAPLSLSSFLMVIVCCFTDAFPCTALVMEQEEFDLLSLQPRNSKKEHLITLKIYAQSYFFIGNTMTFFCNMFFFLYLKEYTGVGFSDLVFTFGNLPEKKLADRGITLEEFNGYYVNTAQCVCFVTLVILQWGNILSVRNRRMSVLQADPFRKQRRNLWLFLGILASFLVAVLVTETPGIQEIMLTNSVPIKYWLLPLPCALFIIIADDVRKLIVRVFPRSFLARIAW
ncbi:calcium-transporting ATPase 1 [Linnemannia elongata AG-77]|uniref:Calcium-transporting ATPase 1 n=1 Tax=Linnemannia elongata AG-77 TaxID=1314771 RepID=A0A197K064_9FUNG|nr:calcium-transporting ATPase 1 [Linnemannia elongata AG-77]